MNRNDPFSPIEHLISEPGFRTKDELGSFCLSIGLFNGEDDLEPVKPSRNWDPSNYEIWPMVEIIAYTKEPTIKNMSEMKSYLYPYLLSGLEILKRKIGDRQGLEAIRSISDLIPP